MHRLLLSLILGLITVAAQAGEFDGVWRSSSKVSAYSPSKKFYLDIKVFADGTFEGTWEPYTWVPLSNFYAGLRSHDLSQVSGWFDFSRGVGEIALEGLGRTNVVLQIKSPETIALSLPPKWLGRDSAILNQSTLQKQ